MTMKNIELIGNNLRILRENAGFNQQSIATFLGVDQSFISKIEKGERAVSAEMLEKLATLFGVNASSVLQKETVSKTLSCAFRGSELGPVEMEAICSVNRIALNSEFMHGLLEENER